ncbi:MULTISPECIES: polyamine ABC transporter substrate-binding protein [Thermus]|jgi:spermidine/putrescine transport system substrate-binding protein|uniref:Spermidine/putrescine ABC transporter substrate-binding protein n=1 Tax=Thermus brockianus TaxID=56956 RepID=A0A1J0LUQ5_THEBO|nr:spermidine/putrescine ABC transporter substrate-binding protein [Thermus brockianus]APD09850.1 Spermidine/putrescine-binding periplasmic protein [Thermus brockianus]BDG16838.1 spermidine/putrescine ABC transporter substrate-binding protein [Thermus brockianus]
MRRGAFLLLLVVLVLLGVFLLRPRPAQGAGTLYFLNWADYIPEELVRKFEAETGAKVVLDTFESPEAMLAKLKAGADQEFSLVVAPDYYVLQMAREGLIAPLDKGRLANLKNLDPFFQDPPYDPGLQYSVPYLWGTTGIAYREDLVQGPVDSYAVLFDPARQVGPFLLLDEMRETIGAALKYLGYSVNTTDPAALEKAKELLLSAKGRSVGFAGGIEALNRILAGDAALALAYSGDVLQARQEDERLRYAIPKEGGTLWTDAMVVLKRGPAQELAYRFIDFLLEPENAAALAEYTRYATPVAAAIPLLPEAMRQDPVVFPPEEVRAKLEYLKDLGPDIALFDRVWTEVKAR